MSEDLCFDMAIEDAQRAGWILELHWSVNAHHSMPKDVIGMRIYVSLIQQFPYLPRIGSINADALPGISAVWMGSRGNGAFYPVQAAQLRKDDQVESIQTAQTKHHNNSEESQMLILPPLNSHKAGVVGFLHANSPWKPIHVSYFCDLRPTQRIACPLLQSRGRDGQWDAPRNGQSGEACPLVQYRR